MATLGRLRLCKLPRVILARLVFLASYFVFPFQTGRQRSKELFLAGVGGAHEDTPPRAVDRRLSQTKATTGCAVYRYAVLDCIKSCPISQTEDTGGRKYARQIARMRRGENGLGTL